MTPSTTVLLDEWVDMIPDQGNVWIGKFPDGEYGWRVTWFGDDFESERNLGRKNKCGEARGLAEAIRGVCAAIAELREAAELDPVAFDPESDSTDSEIIAEFRSFLS
ncbi:hypothetical protein [Nocardia sp. NPDC057030]|uniref:hypothetical protein n=1 Tax=unclassified Nocardia TaxID=2637762 RepID=UPI003628957C